MEKKDTAPVWAGVLDRITDFCKKQWVRFQNWIDDLNEDQQFGLGGIVIVSLVSWFVGGAVYQFAIGGLMVNALLWAIISRIDKIMDFMRKRGHVLDVLLTLASFMGGAGTLGGWLVGLMAAGYFTLFRMLLAPQETEEDEPEAETTEGTPAWGWAAQQPAAA